MSLEDLHFPAQKNKSSPLYFESRVGKDKKGTLKVKGEITPPHPKLSFDLNIKLNELDLSQFSYYGNDGQPAKVKKGTVNLQSRAQCREDILEIKNKFNLEKVDVSWSKSKIGRKLKIPEKLWAQLSEILPFQKELTAELEVLITGDIHNPKLRYSVQENRLQR